MYFDIERQNENSIKSFIPPNHNFLPNSLHLFISRVWKWRMRRIFFSLGCLFNEQGDDKYQNTKKMFEEFKFLNFDNLKKKSHPKLQNTTPLMKIVYFILSTLLNFFNLYLIFLKTIKKLLIINFIGKIIFDHLIKIRKLQELKIWLVKISDRGVA